MSLSDSYGSCPEPTLKRLPIYYHFLRDELRKGVMNISATDIANALGLKSIQVRKDLQMTRLEGKPKVGYNLRELILSIEAFLGWENRNKAVLIGAGNLGSALLGYKGFEDYGLNIVAAFDISPNIIGRVLNGISVHALEDLNRVVRDQEATIGILTVPRFNAQEMAENLMDSGIKAIWNFAPTRIVPRDDVFVQNENLASSLAVLSQKLAYIKGEKND